jgi:ParB/RepB/Spo0J family partition protein
MTSSLPIEFINPSPHNPRKTFPEDSLRELAESIRQVGVLQPILVRPTFGAEDEYELVAGERRWRAAQLAGLDRIPVVVRDLTDIQAAEVQVIENLQRADISPIEEASGFRRLLDLGGYTAESLAEKLGKSRSHVFQRLRLLKMDPAITAALLEGTITPSVADLLSTVPESIQAKALKTVVEANPTSYQVPHDPEADGTRRAPTEPLSFRSAKKLLRQKFTRRADGAHFDTTDETLNAPAGPCSVCPYRAGTQPDLYPDLDGQTCLNPDCHEAKARESFGRKLEQIPAKKRKGFRVLTAGEILEAFGFQSITEIDDEAAPQWHAHFRLLGDTSFHPFQELGVNWLGVAEKVGVTPVMTLHPAKPHEILKFVSEKECRAAAEAQGLLANARDDSWGGKPDPEERKAAELLAERENGINALASKMALPECIKAAASWDKGEASFWGGFLKLITDDGTFYDPSEFHDVLEQAGVTAEKLPKQNEGVLRELATSWLLGATGETDNISPYTWKTYDGVCTWLGVSWKAIRKQAEKVVDAAEKAKDGAVEATEKPSSKRRLGEAAAKRWSKKG